MSKKEMRCVKTGEFLEESLGKFQCNDCKHFSECCEYMGFSEELVKESITKEDE